MERVPALPYCNERLALTRRPLPLRPPSCRRSWWCNTSRSTAWSLPPAPFLAPAPPTTPTWWGLPAGMCRGCPLNFPWPWLPARQQRCQPPNAPLPPLPLQTTATVPTVTFTVRLAAYTPANFTSAVQDQFITAIQAAAPGGGQGGGLLVGGCPLQENCLRALRGVTLRARTERPALPSTPCRSQHAGDAVQHSRRLRDRRHQGAFLSLFESPAHGTQRMRQPRPPPLPAGRSSSS